MCFLCDSKLIENREQCAGLNFYRYHCPKCGRYYIHLEPLQMNLDKRGKIADYLQKKNNKDRIDGPAIELGVEEIHKILGDEYREC